MAGNRLILIVLGSLTLVSPAYALDQRIGTWSGGAGIGFLGNTPDGTAFALNAHADYFLQPQLSVGPLAQIALTGDLFQFGLSAQVKYWLPLPGMDSRWKANVQGGFGFVHADLHNSDTSWLLPLGVGVEYAVTPDIALTTTFLLNFTDLDTGRGTGTNVMPGLTFGVRF